MWYVCPAPVLPCDIDSVFYGRTSAALIHTTELLQKQIQILADIPYPVKKAIKLPVAGTHRR